MHFVSIGFHTHYTLTLLLFSILLEVMSSTAQHQYTDDHLLAGARKRSHYPVASFPGPLLERIYARPFDPGFEVKGHVSTSRGGRAWLV